MFVSFVSISIHDPNKPCKICKKTLGKSDIVAHDGSNGLKHPFHKECAKIWAQNHSTCRGCDSNVNSNSLLTWKERVVKKVGEYAHSVKEGASKALEETIYVAKGIFSIGGLATIGIAALTGGAAGVGLIGPAATAGACIGAAAGTVSGAIQTLMSTSPNPQVTAKARLAVIGATSSLLAASAISMKIAQQENSLLEGALSGITIAAITSVAIVCIGRGEKSKTEASILNDIIPICIMGSNMHAASLVTGILGAVIANGKNNITQVGALLAAFPIISVALSNIRDMVTYANSDALRNDFSQLREVTSKSKKVRSH